MMVLLAQPKHEGATIRDAASFIIDERVPREFQQRYLQLIKMALDKLNVQQFLIDMEPFEVDYFDWTFLDGTITL